MDNKELYSTIIECLDWLETDKNYEKFKSLHFDPNDRCIVQRHCAYKDDCYGSVDLTLRYVNCSINTLLYMKANKYNKVSDMDIETAIELMYNLNNDYSKLSKQPATYDVEIFELPIYKER